MGCSRHTSWQIGSAESSTVRTTNIYPFPKMLPDRALGSGEGSPSRSARWAGVGHGQAAGSQAQQDEGADRGAGLRAVVLAQLLPGLQPHRRGVLQDQGDTTQGVCQDSRDPTRSVGRSVVRDQLTGCPGILRARRLPSYGSTTMKRAVDQDSTRGTFAFSTGPAGHRGPEGLQGQVGEG